MFTISHKNIAEQVKPAVVGGGGGVINAWGIHGSTVTLSNSNSMMTTTGGPSNGAAGSISAAYITGGNRMAEFYFDPAYPASPFVGVTASPPTWDGSGANYIWGYNDVEIFQAMYGTLYGGLWSSTITNNGVMPSLAGKYVQVAVDYTNKRMSIYFEGTLYCSVVLSGAYSALALVLSGDDPASVPVKATINTSGPFHNQISGYTPWAS